MNQIQQIDRQKYPPTLICATGAAWEINLEKYRAERSKQETAKDATVCAWFVWCPWAHPLWHYYLIFCVHLREEKGVPPPKILLPGATHEVSVYALDPQKVPDFAHPMRTILRPVNFVGQWDVYSRLNPVDQDKTANATIQNVVSQIVHGTLNPDTDAREQWVALFSDSNFKR